MLHVIMDLNVVAKPILTDGIQQAIDKFVVDTTQVDETNPVPNVPPP